MSNFAVNKCLDFFEPVLKSLIRYERGVGLFSAGWLRINAQGMSVFARNSGVARCVTSPILSKNDCETLKITSNVQLKIVVVSQIGKKVVFR